ncbi:MAG: flagellar motor switch protein FliN [Magnetococcales bacterium]|nr:flagellar motor switch protein FliN [Magnetococcales bacterium]
MDDSGALLDPNILRELEMGGERPASSGGGMGVLGADGLPKNMELLMDVPLEVSVRLGQVKMQIRDLLKLNKGALIELGREADDPLEIHVNNRLLAYGEVVMIKDKLGIRITDIVSLAERLENLRR